MSSLSKTKDPGDFLIMESDPEFGRESGTLRNPATATGVANLTEVAGHPVKLNGTQWELLIDTDEANVGGWIIDGPAIKDLAVSGITVGKYSILVRGPAVINQDRISANDAQGSAYTIATLVANLPSTIIARTEPTNTEEQTT